MKDRSMATYYRRKLIEIALKTQDANTFWEVMRVLEFHTHDELTAAAKREGVYL